MQFDVEVLIGFWDTNWCGHFHDIIVLLQDNCWCNENEADHIENSWFQTNVSEKLECSLIPAWAVVAATKLSSFENHDTAVLSSVSIWPPSDLAVSRSFA